MERARLKIVLATIVINVSAVVWFSIVPWSDWRTGMALNFVDNVILAVYAFKFKDVFMGQLMLFGLGVGIAELPADAWLVAATRTLDYSIGGGPMVWRSPLWMPLAWEIVAVQFGYIGLMLWERLGLKGLLAAGALGAVNIPFYEEMALKIHWWSYRGCRMFLHTPYYIIAGEFLIVLVLGWLARPLRELRWVKSFWCGIVAGLLIFLCYVVGFWVFEGHILI